MDAAKSVCGEGLGEAISARGRALEIWWAVAVRYGRWEAFLALYLHTYTANRYLDYGRLRGRERCESIKNAKLDGNLEIGVCYPPLTHK